MRKTFLQLVICGCLSASAEASSTTPNLIGHFGKWQAYTTVEEGKKVCYMTTAPTKSEGKYTTRGDAYVIITHRPYLKNYNSVSVDMGYTLDPKSSVKLVIDNKNFEINLIQNETAWAATSGEDKTITQAIAKARTGFVIHGKSTKGTATKDTYPVAGAAAALKAISRECGYK